jgi:hypothetical protein
VKRWIKYFLWAFVGFAVIPAATLFLYWVWLQRATTDFYRSRPILHSMKSVRPSVSTNNSDSARSALLGRFPIGTEQNDILAALKSEDFDCGRQAPSTAPVECQLLAPAVVGYTQWIVTLQFEEPGRLTDARVAVWHIFL